MDLILPFLVGFMMPFIIDFIPRCYYRERHINERNRNA